MILFIAHQTTQFKSCPEHSETCTIRPLSNHLKTSATDHILICVVTDEGKLFYLEHTYCTGQRSHMLKL